MWTEQVKLKALQQQANATIIPKLQGKVTDQSDDYRLLLLYVVLQSVLAEREQELFHQNMSATDK